MNCYQRLFVLITVLSPLLLADQVILKNGDTITGSIVKKDGDKLTIKSEFLGEVTMPWTAVTAIKSDAPLFVGLPQGKEVTGKLTTAGGTVEVETPSGRQNAPLAEISSVRNQAEEDKYRRMLAPGWLDLWAGYFDLGYAIARGNAKTDTLTTAFTASRPTRTDKMTVYFNQIYSTASISGKNGTTAEAVRGGLSYDHNLHPRLFANVFNDYEYDAFQNLDLRFVLGGGLGLHLINRDRTKLDVLAGANYDREVFSTNLTRSSGELYWGNTLLHKISGATSLTQSFRMFNNLSDSGQYRFNFDLGTATVIKKWLTWQITASDRFLSNPDPGRQRNDLLLTTGLRVNFAK